MLGIKHIYCKALYISEGILKKSVLHEHVVMHTYHALLVFEY